jgi:hypothetical protein
MDLKVISGGGVVEFVGGRIVGWLFAAAGTVRSFP